MSDLEVEMTYLDWHAIHDHMRKTLRVYGDIKIPGGGFAVGLERVRSGINPGVLELGVHVSPTGESPSEQSAEHAEDWDDATPITQVHFRSSGPVSVNVPDTLDVEDVY